MFQRKKHLKEIREALMGLYFLTAPEIDRFMERIEKMNNEGLEEMLKVLSENIELQDDFLAIKIREDKSFVKNLDTALQKKTADIMKQFEGEHKEAAEDILKGLKKIK